jgi:hypothetical protein
MKKAKESRNFCEVDGGKYDKYGFYHTPNGSFWDCDGIYFNREGVDIHGGYYDENVEYHPGEGWVESLMCYEDEINPNQKPELNNYSNQPDQDDYEDGDYDVYEDIQDDLRHGNYSGPSYYDAVKSNPKYKGGNQQKQNQQQQNNTQNQSSSETTNNNNISSSGQQPQEKVKIYKPILLDQPLTVNAKTEAKIAKESKETVNVESISNKEVKEALKNKKDVSCKGYIITEDLLSDDDDQGGQVQKGKKHKK